MACASILLFIRGEPERPITCRLLTTVLLNFTSVMERMDEQILPAVYAEIGSAFKATPIQLGYLTLSRALVQAFASPLGGIAGDFCVCFLLEVLWQDDVQYATAFPVLDRGSATPFRFRLANLPKKSLEPSRRDRSNTAWPLKVQC